jgi:ABC-type Fe3+/spermidine/putrescine transport system ATPase subunit
MREPILHIDQVVKRFDSTVAADSLTLTIYRGEFFTFLGPSGSGKSTILRMIAGLVRPDGGRILIAGRDMADVPPWQRSLGMVFQHYAVFPHMTVAQNVGYGLRVRHRPPGEVRDRIADLLQLVGLVGMERKNVTLLSGGEQQRVALARALAVQPALLLLDEPLAALDEKIRREMQAELKRIQRKTHTTFVYVTHDQEEALTMSDRIAVVHRGVCVQCDQPEVLFRRPRTRFVASFFRGSNVLEADLVSAGADGATLRLAGRPVAVRTDIALSPRQPRVAVAVRAETVRVGASAQGCSVVLRGRVVDVVYRGTNVDHLLELEDGQRITATSIQREVGPDASAVSVGFDPGDVVILGD